ncbi:hypothetical protein CCM_00162 [Cordyceps militaris CM01]|uniref:Uncharacterized protein n=1 Tax=Cordyceps militaris (strain CM01) TaxID=983644 RepID=G3J7P2_CORMM|nr:uncharacterized protein CCM_00162 [Cordyceps militaris CM01]EGX95508.1 hypothetical protein CCM_00162 [Cordyceps militaris CM01]
MVVGILVALVAGVAICHSCHKKHQRIDAFKRNYEAHNGPLTKEQWKQLCHEHKQALKAEKHARKAEKHMRRAEHRRGCWRTSLPAPVTPAAFPEMDVKYADADGFPVDPAMPTQRIQIPVQGPDEPPAYMQGSVTAPPEKM